MRTLNLGILAHVDAGKTSLTERLLYAAGVIDEIGSVDDGSTQTDSLALERRRGITIKSAVASFTLDEVTVNLIDTPGHPDFIAEVERVLAVLDGVVLVVSAVEGVQPQTRVLMRALRRLQLPTLIFVNKIDRVGAAYGATLDVVAERLTPAVVAMGAVADIGTSGARFVPHDHRDRQFTERLTTVLAEHDDDLLAAYVAHSIASRNELIAALADQTGRALVHPVFFGSAITGAGVEELMRGVRELLPTAGSSKASDTVSATVFKVERAASGERVAYVRVFSGALHLRDEVRVGGRRDAKVTAINVFDGAAVVARDSAGAGELAKVAGLGDVRIGDSLGRTPSRARTAQFGPPTLESIVVARGDADRRAMHVALAQLAEQDPLIDLRQDDVRQETVVSLYGEVQKEVIQATLAEEFGVEVEFRQTTPVCIERPAGLGTAAEFIKVDPNPFLATVGLRIDPAPVGSGVRFDLEIELGSLPFAFVRAVDETSRETLRQGLYGWEVTDCTITLTHSDYWARQSHSHGTFDKNMSSTAGDFRNLTPLVVMAALREAGTTVHEPLHRFELELPVDALSAVLQALARVRAVPRSTELRGRVGLVQGEIPAAGVHQLRQQLPGLTRGEAVLESAFERYEFVRAPVPSRARTDHSPLNRKEYLLHAVRRVNGQRRS